MPRDLGEQAAGLKPLFPSENDSSLNELIADRPALTTQLLSVRSGGCRFGTGTTASSPMRHRSMT